MSNQSTYTPDTAQLHAATLHEVELRPLIITLLITIITVISAILIIDIISIIILLSIPGILSGLILILIN